MSMSFNSWITRLVILMKFKAKFEDSDCTLIKGRLMKNKLL